MANLTPRDIWGVPGFRVPSVLDDFDDVLSLASDQNSGLSISEDERNVYIQAAVPGVDPSKVEVVFDRGVLWIRGAGQQEERDKDRKFYRRAAEEFSYRIAVPGDIDPNVQPEAQYKNGMIQVVFPKKPQAEPKKLTVKVNADSNSKGKKTK